MGRFLFWTVIFLVIGGFLLHFEVYIPFFSAWFGKLPGDFVIQKKNVAVHFPVVSSAIISIFLSFIIWLFTKKKEK